MISLYRLFPPAIVLFMLLTSCAHRQVLSSNEYQLKQLSLEIEAGSVKNSSGIGHVASNTKSSGLVSNIEPENLNLATRRSLSQGKKTKENLPKASVPGLIKAKKLIKVIKEIKEVKKSKQKDFNKDNIVLTIGLYTFVIGLILFLVFGGLFISTPGASVAWFVGLLIGLCAMILSLPIMLIGLLVGLAT